MGNDTFNVSEALKAIRADKAPKRGRKKGSKTRPKKTVFHDDFDNERALLIEKIEKIYKKHDHVRPEEIPLTNYTEEQLRNHLNRLQWGLCNLVTGDKSITETPDEIPPDGWFCDMQPFHQIWTNAKICEPRISYPSMYPGCKSCVKWQQVIEDEP